MDKKMEDLLKKIKLNNNYFETLNDATIEKIVIDSKKNRWNVIFNKETKLNIDCYKALLDSFQQQYPDKEILLTINVLNSDKSNILDYYQFILEQLKKELPVSVYFNDRLVRTNEGLFIEVNNKAEARQINSILPNINKYLNIIGFKEEVAINLNEIKRAEIVKEITAELEVVKVPKKVTKKTKEKPTDLPDRLWGRPIKDEPINIKDIIGEENNITIEGYIFGVEYFSSTKTNFKIITIKITDYTDSIYCKVFSKDEEYELLKDQIKAGNWYKIRGYTKYDIYSKEIVLNVRDINISLKKEAKIIDTSPEKRVELHTHTFMSQMDGLINAKKLIKFVRNLGHKAVAITDKNGCQSFPDVYYAVRDINNNLKENEKPFKALYGAEMLMIDDAINIVIRPKKEPLLNNTYVVFDFETTGFNAFNGDSIIEIGAVKLNNGEIIDRFSELINPGHQLNPKITELTGITDEMLANQEKEEIVVKKFINWFSDYPMVAHNAKFDVSFLESAFQKYSLGNFTNTVVDTLELSRTLDNTYARHSLSAIVRRYDVNFDENSHHRADYDAEATALVFHKMMKKLEDSHTDTINALNDIISKEDIHKYGRGYHVNLLVKNKTGLKNLFKLISLANTTYLHKNPRILRSEINNLREGLLVGSSCYQSEVFIEAKSKSEEEMTSIINFYDYVEIQPLECYNHLLQMGDFAKEEELKNHINKIIKLVQNTKTILVATGDVHHLTREDKIYRSIIVNQKVPGGGRHFLAKDSIKEIPSTHFRTTNEMLEDFKFLDNKLAYEIVITNPNKIADMIEEVEVIIETGGIPFSPKMKDSAQIVKDSVYEKAHTLYGKELPKIVLERIEAELNGIIKGGFDVVYLIAQKLVKKSNDDGYLVGSRGSVGSSLVATLLEITEVNPLPAHYLCNHCQHSIFEINNKSLSLDYSSGYDLPDMRCPICDNKMGKEGQDMPFATFLGFDANKVPDIDLNFSGEYQWKAHEYTKELFGVDNVYRAGTIGTVADKTAYGFTKGYFEDNGIINVRSAEIERLALGCTGVKRTTGQHPGGIVVIPDYMDVYDFTPFQYPADDNKSLWRTTHFDYHAIDQNILKLDILGHDDPTILKMLQDLSGIDVTTLPFDDPKIISILSSTKALNVKPEQIMCNTGTLGVPELGTKFVIQMLEETKPKTFGELVKISGLSHGTDVWAGNASELIKNKIVSFKEIIGCRDDIMIYLIKKGLPAKEAFEIMEFVRKGRASKDKNKWEIYAEKMHAKGVPDWYIDSCYKIKYMFPKAHAVAYVMSALRIAWFKVYQPINYYAAYFSIRSDDYDIQTMIKGYDAIKRKIEELKAKGYEVSNKENNILTTLEIALEATARGIKFANIDIDKSHSKNFLVLDETTLLPPFKVIDGLGDTVANLIIKERKKQPFISIEDFAQRGKVSVTLLERMRMMDMLKDLPESSQMSLF